MKKRARKVSDKTLIRRAWDHFRQTGQTVQVAVCWVLKRYRISNARQARRVREEVGRRLDQRMERRRKGDGLTPWLWRNMV